MCVCGFQVMVAAGRSCSAHACVSRELQIKGLLLARFLRISPWPRPHPVQVLGPICSSVGAVFTEQRSALIRIHNHNSILTSECYVPDLSVMSYVRSLTSVVQSLSKFLHSRYLCNPNTKGSKGLYFSNLIH